ncbi:MAG: hypothetical protein ABL925_02980 [Methylococcales bacterium]
MTFENSSEIFKMLAVAILIAGIFMYGVLLIGIYFLKRWQDVKLILENRPNVCFGLPFSAVAAFGIVSLLNPNSPSDKDIAFKAFNLDFTGPAGPVTMWILCFMAFVWAIKALSNDS